MNSILGAFRAGAVTSNEPLRRMLDKYITDQVIDEVAREYGKGRRLLVGTTNLDSERLRRLTTAPQSIDGPTGPAATPKPHRITC